uniref:Mut7-C RNAse domain-containing protein n=1 Tax=Globisporangium ultimum (strain ATCC 200006 / CBS 805.95 / DAOM BR144) TaxID=431595 RepID=K3X4Q3_GLOUD
MVSQVARWLRVIGVDVVTWRSDLHDKDGTADAATTSTAKSQSHRAQLLAFASGEQRIVITRDAQLASRRDAGACFVLSSDVCYKQFREIKTQFGLYARKKGSKSRCARCNSTEFATIDVEYVRTQRHEVIHAKVLETVTNFWMCVQCDKIYWEGPKYTTTTTTSDGSKYGEVVYQPTHRKRNPRTHTPRTASS